MNDATTPSGPVIVNGVLYGEDALVAVWMSERAGANLIAEPFVAFGLLDMESQSTNLSERLIAGVYFFRQAREPFGRDIHIAASLDGVTMQYRQAIRQVLAYPFTQLGLPRITAEIEENNTRSLRAAEQLGFVVEGRKRFMAPGGGDFLVLGLYPENCPFLRD